MGVICIYKIVCNPTGRCYVGSTIHRDRRWRFHRWQLNRGEHHSFRLQRAWNKHGAGSFSFQELETFGEANKTELEIREQFWMDHLKPELNRTPTTHRHALGMKFGPPSEETRENIRRAVTGKRHTPETLAKMSAAFKGRKLNLTEERREQLREEGRTRFLGKTHTEAVRRLIGEQQRGRKASEETLKRKSRALKDKPWSQSRAIAERDRPGRPGIWYRKSRNRWYITRMIEGKRYRFGTFVCLGHAIKAYDAIEWPTRLAETGFEGAFKGL